MYETIHREQSWLQYSKVHQRWRQEAIYYTDLEAPSCQMNRNWPYRYTDYNTAFAENRSLSESVQSPTHIECSSVFPSQETGTDAISSSHAKFKQFFMFFFLFLIYNFSCEGSFSFGQSSKHLSADHLRCDHRRFNMATSVGLVSYILEALGPRGELLTANEFSRATLCATCENRDTKLHKLIFACHNLACKPPQNASTRTTLGHFQTVRLRANSGQTES